MLVLSVVVVAVQGYAQGYATVPKPADLEAHLKAVMYNP